MQVYFLRRERVPVPVSTVTLIAVTITYKMVLVATGLFMALFRLDFLRAHFGGTLFLFWLGLTLTVGWIVLLFLLAFHPHLARVLTEGFFRLLEKLRILRRNETRREKLLTAMDTYHETASYFKGRLGLMGLVQAIAFVQRFALFTVPWLVCRAFGVLCPWRTAATLQATVSVCADMLPLPGGMGVSEGLFLTLFEPVFGALVLPAMVLSRGVEFYCRLALSAAFTAVAALVLGRHREKYTGRLAP